MRRIRNISFLLLFLLIYQPLIGQIKLLEKADIEFALGNVSDANKLYLKYIEKLKKKIKIVNYYDTVATASFQIAEKFRKAGFDGSFWYKEAISDFKGISFEFSSLGYARIYKEFALSYWYLADTANAGYLLKYAFEANNKDELVSKYYGEYLFSQGLFHEAAVVFSFLNDSLSINHLLFESAIFAEKKQQEMTRMAASSFPYDESTIFYCMDGIGVFAYNSQTDEKIRIWTCDSITQIFGNEYIMQINDSTLLINVVGPDYYIYPDSTSLCSIHVLNDYYISVKLKSLDSYISKHKKIIEYNNGVTCFENDVEIVTEFFNYDGQRIDSTKELMKEVHTTIMNMRGHIYVSEEDSVYRPYFYFKEKTEEINGRQIISDTSGLWLKEEGVEKLLKPYKMTFYGHYPMGYVMADLSPDAQKVLYVSRIKHPWEESFVPTAEKAVKNGSLHLLDLTSNIDTMIVNYMIYYPLFSANQRLCAYTKVFPEFFQRNLLEIYDFKTSHKRTLDLVEDYIWYKYE